MNVLYKPLKKVWGACLGLSASMAIVTSSIAQTIDVQVGTQTGTTSNVPLVTNYGYNYSQQIYTVADLNNAGINGSAEITKIRFYKTSGNLNNSTQWVVYLGNTAKTDFTSNTDWEVIGNLQEVFTGTVTDAGNNVWQEITFTTPYTWNGTSNLIVAVDENQSNWGTLAYWQKSDLGANRAIYYRDDNNNPDPASPPTAYGRIGSVNNIQLVAAPAISCSGSPAISDILSSEGINVCEGDNTVLSIDNGGALYFLDGITYQWQQFDGTNWVDISGATTASYSIEGIENSTDYQVIIGCTHSTQEVILAPISITVNAAPAVVVDIEESVICPSSSVPVTASGATTYAWAPATGLNVTNTATVNANPTATTLYTVTGTDANGCTATAQTTVIPYGNVSTQTVTNPAELCESNVSTSITIDEVADVVGGSWEYRFLAADGTTEVQPWNSTNVYNFIPTQDSVYTFYYQLKNSACTSALDSVKVTVTVGFGAEDVVVVDYDCINLGGSATLVNPFGQKEVLEVYSNDLNTPADFSDFTVTGIATHTANRLQLTTNAPSVLGTARWSVPGFSTGTNNSFSVAFNLTADQPYDQYGTGGGDGLTYSFGDDATSTANGNGHNGYGTKLRLCFDAAGNSSENNNMAGIYLVYGWTAGNAFGPANSQTLAYSPNTNLWKTKTDIPVVFNINSDGTANLTVDGVTIFENVQLPAAYLTANVSNWYHLFSARTGGDALRHAVDNINITSGALLYGITQNATAAPADWQTSPVFSDLLPGTYYVWASKDSAATCGKQIETIVISNDNPVIDLGADTTICDGETLVLDAGNPGASYVWSNSNNVNQTMEVSAAGTYTVYATAANGCFGVGTINVAVNEEPTATGIYRQGSYPNFTFTVLNAQNAASYNWNFGDGTTLNNAPATVQHFYTSDAAVNVSVTLTNDCGSTQVTASYADLSVEENQLSELKIFPNPATDNFKVSLNNAANATVSAVSTTGAIVLNDTSFSNEIIINTAQWEKGIYFVTVTSNGSTTTSKIVIR
jgi:hypothetical protein